MAFVDLRLIFFRITNGARVERIFNLPLYSDEYTSMFLTLAVCEI